MKTYKEARTEILAYLSALGWEIKPTLKVPQAITPKENIIRFKPQAVYLNEHSLWIDIRVHSGESFVCAVEQAERRGW